MIEQVRIGGRFVGPGYPCLVIAEAGVNHNGSMETAFRLIDGASRAGADAVKFQSFITEEIIIPEAPKANYQVSTTGGQENQFKMLKALELSAEQHQELRKYCEQKGIMYLCTPYEKTSVDMLEKMGVAAFKVASTDTSNIPFLKYVAGKGRPVILSTGMSSQEEVERAVQTLWAGGLQGKIILLHCTSEYPSPRKDSNLRAIRTLEKAFECPVGYSDHTPGVGVSPWAVAVGACVIEKHFTLDRNMEGPDHGASLDVGELEQLMLAIREVELALGDGIKRPMESEIQNKRILQKSLVSLRDIKAGEIIAEKDLTCKRPGSGLEPFWMDKVVGKKAAEDIPENTVLTLSSIRWED